MSSCSFRRSAAHSPCLIVSRIHSTYFFVFLTPNALIPFNPSSLQRVRCPVAPQFDALTYRKFEFKVGTSRLTEYRRILRQRSGQSICACEDKLGTLLKLVFSAALERFARSVICISVGRPSSVNRIDMSDSVAGDLAHFETCHLPPASIQNSGFDRADNVC